MFFSQTGLRNKREKIKMLLMKNSGYRKIKLKYFICLFAFIFMGCGSNGSSSNTVQESSTSPKPTLSDVSGFVEWLKFSKEPIDGSTHGKTNIYINQTRGAITSGEILVYPFPENTIIVKEIISSGDIAIMRKVKGVDAEHGDWQFIEYKSGGAIIGQDSSCWGCHSSAKSTDYVFSKLEAE
jgi:hypothetical protein